VTFTDEQLWAAVRSAGRDGQSFTCATVRDVLGMSSKKRHDLAQFRDRFRAFRLTASAGIEKVGKSAYRLTDTEEQDMSEMLIEFELIAIADDAAEAADGTAPSVVEASAPPAAQPTVPEVPDVSLLDVATPVVAVQPPAMPYHPAAIEESDMGFGEPMVASAGDSGELAANHVIFSAWPASMQPTAAETDDAAPQSAAQQAEAKIEAEVRDLVTGSDDRQPNAPESLIAQAEQAVVRTWRDGGHWLGRRFAELFSRTQN
jgi:hypothetical protein